MTVKTAMGILLIVICLVAAPGCQIGRIVYHPTAPPSFGAFDDYDVVLAADFIQDPQETSAPPARTDAEKKAEVQDTKPDEDDEEAEAERRYTVPGPQYRQFAALALGVAAFGTGDVYGTGKEAAESQVNALSAIVGRPGLSAPPPTVASAVVGRPGLQQGFAVGLGSASDRNIFTARMNPLSGSSGRCSELARAGFFGRDRTACESSFRK